MKISIISDEISQSVNDVVDFLKKNNIRYIDLRSINNKNLVVKIGGTDLNKVEFWKTFKKNSIKNSSNTVLRNWNDHFHVIKNVSLNLLGKKSKIISCEDAKETIIFIENLYKCSKYVGRNE